MIPAGYRVVTRPELGTHYVVHVIVGPDGREVYAQLSPYAAGEVAERVRRHLAPTPAVPPLAFGKGDGKPTRRKSPGRPRKGEAWRGSSLLTGEGEA